MECSCAVDVYSDDFEPVACFTNGIRKARVDHKCRECRSVITRGETYNYSSYVFDGKWFDDKVCNDCQSVINQFFPSGGYYDLWPEITEEVSESEGEVPESCIAKLTPKARERLCDIIDEHNAQQVRHHAR